MNLKNETIKFNGKVIKISYEVDKYPDHDVYTINITGDGYSSCLFKYDNSEDANNMYEESIKMLKGTEDQQ